MAKRQTSKNDTVSLGDLKPDPKNARKHNPRNVGMIVSALHEVGAARSGVIDEDGVILAGNATAEALAEAGIEKVRVINGDGNEWVVVRRSGLTAEQKRKLALYDNRTAELADWDPEEVLASVQEDLDLSGLWTDKEMDEMLRSVEPGEGEAPEAKTGQAEELQKKWQTEKGQVWMVGRHRVACGESTKAETSEALLGGAQPDGICTDPPYEMKADTVCRAMEHLASVAIVLAGDALAFELVRYWTFRRDFIWHHTKPRSFPTKNQAVMYHNHCLSITRTNRIKDGWQRPRKDFGSIINIGGGL